jgi:hypothetical protein
MEEAMDQETRNRIHKFGRENSSQLEFNNAVDATGFWFATAVTLAILAAVVIVYRTANADIRTASNDLMPAAAYTDPIASPVILLQ